MPADAAQHRFGNIEGAQLRAAGCCREDPREAAFAAADIEDALARRSPR